MTSRADAITRISSLLTALTSFMVALSIPVGYFVISYQYIGGGINAEIALSARIVEQLINNNPDSWQFEELRLRDILEHRLDHHNRETRIIRDARGAVIAQTEEALASPAVTFSEPVYDSGTEVARIEIKRSIAPLVVHTAVIGACSTLSGIMIFLIFRFFPLRAVREAYRKVAENEQRLTLAIMSGRFGVCDWDIKKGAVVWDDRMYEIYGLSRDSVKDVVGTWQNCIHREDRDRILADIDPDIPGRAGYSTKFRIVRPDGALRYVTADGILIKDGEGKVSRAISLHHDITKRVLVDDALRKSEEYFRAITENASDVLFIVDKRGIIKYSSPSVKWVVGYSPEALTGRSCLDLILPDDIPRAVEDFSQSLLTKDVVVQNRLRIKHKDGSVLVMDGTGKNLLHNPTIAGFVMNVRDITASTRVEQEKADLQTQVQQAQKMESVGRLAGGVAHDFNNMLGVSLGRVELAMMTVDPAQPLYSNLKEIRKAAERSADLTRQLLAFARKQQVSPKVLDVNNTVAGMLKMIYRLVGENIHLAWMPGINVWLIKIDPSQVDQILANLCVNARDAIADVGKITIETGNISFDESYCADHAGFCPGDYVLMSVSDNGCGMDKDILGNLFEPFFTTKELGKGTGLGLATVYGIIKQNNGFINVYSEPGQGTTFRIYLPRYEGQAADPEMERAAEIPLGRGETVLVVEDEPVMLDISKLILEMQGYRVLTANLPGKAIRMAEDHSGEIDLLLTDVVMPEMNGSELAKRILALYPNVKCLFMSGYTADAIARHGVLDEGVLFLQKPFSRSDLATKVREVLDRK